MRFSPDAAESSNADEWQTWACQSISSSNYAEFRYAHTGAGNRIRRKGLEARKSRPLRRRSRSAFSTDFAGRRPVVDNAGCIASAMDVWAEMAFRSLYRSAARFDYDYSVPCVTRGL